MFDPMEIPLVPGAGVSPLRTPEPRHPDQMTAFPTAVDTTFAADGNPLAVMIRVSFHRAPRQKCVVCGKRRVGFWIGLGDVIAGPILCAKCAGIRA